MGWRVYQVTYELRSSLHIGYHKVGNVQRTRYYLPARNAWGAVTERLTRSGFRPPGASEGDYRAVGEWVRSHCAFTYWFFRDGETLLVPRYSDGGLYYGDLTESDFEREYLAAHVTTALDPATTSAEAGSLHEVETLVAHGRDGVRHHMVGWLFLDDDARRFFGNDGTWRRWLGELYVGGERRCGFGHLQMSDDGWKPQEGGRICEGYRVRCDRARPRIEVTAEKPFLAHTPTEGIHARGSIEPVVGRETVDSSGFGGKLTRGEVCWVPGSICEEAQWLKISRDGMWRKAAG